MSGDGRGTGTDNPVAVKPRRGFAASVRAKVDDDRGCRRVTRPGVDPHDVLGAIAAAIDVRRYPSETPPVPDGVTKGGLWWHYYRWRPILDEVRQQLQMYTNGELRPSAPSSRVLWCPNCRQPHRQHADGSDYGCETVPTPAPPRLVECIDCGEWASSCSCWTKAKKRIAERRDALNRLRLAHAQDLETCRRSAEWRAVAMFSIRIAQLEAELAGLAVAMGDDG